MTGWRIGYAGGPKNLIKAMVNMQGQATAGGRKLATDQDMCMALLEEAHVATVHGAAYGMSPYLRVSTATDDESLAEGCRRIAKFCEGLH
jgi:aspartate aminotransferase